jgi:hypothetical protein
MDAAYASDAQKQQREKGNGKEETDQAGDQADSSAYDEFAHKKPYSGG